MAIRFVDKAAEDGAAKVEAKRPPAMTAEARPEAPVPTRRIAEPDAIEPPTAEPLSKDPQAAEPQTEDAGLPGLVHPKPEPKPRGRKKPLSATGTGAATGDRPAQEPAEALLPGLQVHAKPPPKPRGRKKAFG